MKKVVVLMMILLISKVSFSQESETENFTDQYSRGSIELSFGGTKLRDETPFRFGNIDLGVRYMFVQSFGVRINAAHTKSIEDFTSLSCMGVINLSRLMNIEDSRAMKRFTVLGSLGGLYTDFSDEVVGSEILHRKSGFHLSSRVDILYKIFNSLAFMTSLHNTVGVNNRPFNPESSETTSIININAGFVLYPWKKKRVHADWHILDSKKESDYNALIILEKELDSLKQLYVDLAKQINKDKDIVNNNYVTEVTFDYTAFHFDHDKSTLIKSDVLILEKLVRYLQKFPKKKVLLSGYASLPGTPKYNLGLAERRINTILMYLNDFGINKNRIETKVIGEYTKLSKERLHKFARTVQIEVIK